MAIFSLRRNGLSINSLFSTLDKFQTKMDPKNYISRGIRKVLLKSAMILTQLNLFSFSNIFSKSAIHFDASAQPYFLIAENYLKQGKYHAAALIYKKAISIQPTLSTVYLFGYKRAINGNLNDEFYKALLDVIETKEIRTMMELLSESPEIYQPSKFWLYFMVFNTFQIESDGIENFKRTVNHNYFNWTADSDITTQFNSIKNVLGWSDSDIENAEKLINFKLSEIPIEFSPSKWKTYIQYLCMLWEYVKKNDVLKLINNQIEPQLGNPLAIEYKGNIITQDICNSVMEVNSILEDIVYNPKIQMKVMELGAGHGRIGNILLNAYSNIQIVLVDIPPALYVSQWYLSNLFPQKAIFKFRKIDNYEEIREEFEASTIAFLSPQQIEFIPQKYFDLCINICSLQEMTQKQIEMWFSHIDRVCKGWFYTKQYFESINPYDNIVIHQNDYPEKHNWKKIFSRPNAIFPQLFETKYKIE